MHCNSNFTTYWWWLLYWILFEDHQTKKNYYIFMDSIQLSFFLSMCLFFLFHNICSIYFMCLYDAQSKLLLQWFLSFIHRKNSWTIHICVTYTDVRRRCYSIVVLEWIKKYWGYEWSVSKNISFLIYEKFVKKTHDVDQRQKSPIEKEKKIIKTSTNWI